MDAKGRRRLIPLGLWSMMAGGVLLATTYVFTPPAAVLAAGGVLLVAGVVLVALGAGLRAAWSAFWRLLP